MFVSAALALCCGIGRIIKGGISGMTRGVGRVVSRDNESRGNLEVVSRRGSIRNTLGEPLLQQEPVARGLLPRDRNLPSWRRVILGNSCGTMGYVLMAVGTGVYLNVTYRQVNLYSEKDEVSYFVQTAIAVLIMSIAVFFVGLSELIEQSRMIRERERNDDVAAGRLPPRGIQ